MLRRCWHWLRTPSSAMSRGVLLLVGIVSGVLLWGGFNTAMEHTNTTAFCVSCHEMDQTVHQEYKKSVHYSNRTGVTAGCPDCHVPRPWGAKILRKIRASGELYHVLIGTIDTPEKFEARRLYLAEKVWKEMTENNSRECRNCHSYESMDFHKQTARAREKMEEAKNKNTPCIECHKGIAHNKPVVARDD
jgi:cytochrome c-type protein NapC